MTEPLVLTKARIENDETRNLVWLSGGWTTPALRELERSAFRNPWPDASELTLDATRITQLDTGGAYLLHRIVEHLENQGKTVRIRGLSTGNRDLLSLIETRSEGIESVGRPGRKNPLERLGRGVKSTIDEATALLSFTGETAVAFVRNALHPTHIRWSVMLGIIQRSGVHALPITGLLAFLLGIVIAYQGGIQLKNYGANIFVVELVTVTMIRELGPLIAAIIVAGRTGSAYTAEIGTMRVTEEVDALSTLGISPMDILVLPKVVGLAISLPLLTLYACALGVFGGMVMAATLLDVSFFDFFQRIPSAVSLTTFVIGVGKAPFFAVIIAMVGCFQGFQVSGGADSVGTQTTVSVVQSIFLVIVADAVFSVIFSFIGI